MTVKVFLSSRQAGGSLACRELNGPSEVGPSLFPLSASRRLEDAVLVLSRKKNESIVINDDITIVVVEIRGDKVRLGVEAPKEVPVHRREVFDAIRRNEAATEEKPTGGQDGPPATG
ncbi:MAG: carbon storage regulator CsrA [Candidatus Peribacter riflensis]|uniref:Translational regulator CsrA n=1 Tax=Candidatus Peribacter riflensis TaxID=1735162 RepID=A0A0S1SM96_9BACT|nr:MAG: carbon storage regulator CsrA [Candidatus Peribacter riflensis]ALM11580.1 MAG: carbon storage regulator [Candidatus Peribacter riflensis]ALM12682.1 MAG: carbon storage regulator [Candidatus Peribacter riflensis]ALM13783.1 MAG: carbon storage regulator [Candidatus Peribacter riflensis]ALM14886.1 MAG: carbon storage regulator [Candidatus Peribacter riflensis]